MNVSGFLHAEARCALPHIVYYYLVLPLLIINILLPLTNMPFYELIMLCKIGESHAMGTLVKNVSGAILQEGGKLSYSFHE